LPYAYNGQLRSDVGFASGFVVAQRVVLTAAHAVFDDVNLIFVKNVYWFFQRQSGEFEPLPQIPRGWYVFEGYAALRADEKTPGVSTPVSQDRDVAALYFLEPAGRGGSGGYLTSDNSPNEWLTGTRSRLLVGYPVEMLADPNDAGKMHAAGPFFSGFDRVTNQVYATTAIKSFPGNSGGPVCVLHTNGNYYPAAIYLGGSAQTIVRAIDSTVVDLINRAEISGNAGGDNVGGGVILFQSTFGINPFCTGWVEVVLGPPAATNAGGAWRVSPTNALYSPYTNYTNVIIKIPVQNGSFSIDFKDIPGFSQPTNATVRIICDQGSILYANYQVIPPPPPPQLIWLGQTNLAICGSPTYNFLIEYTNDLRQLSNWIPFRTVTLTNTAPNGTNPIPGAAVPNSGRRYYRAVWQP
jgi:hypothetical protein